MDRHRQKTDIIKLVVTAHNSFANAPKNVMFNHLDCTLAPLQEKWAPDLAEA
jgi:hypothetical protein